jgi:hypothetical protein
MNLQLLLDKYAKKPYQKNKSNRMGLLDIFSSRNKNALSREEKEAAQILKNIIDGYKQSDFDHIPNGIEKLSIGLYYLAFKRTHKKVVQLEDASNHFTIMNNPKFLRYTSIYSAINESIQAFCKDPRVLRSEVPLREYESTVLTLLRFTAEEIKKI